MNKCIPDKKYIFIKTFLAENIVYFKEVWPWNEFEKFFILFSTVRLKSEIKLIIWEFLEVFYFPS